jgi:hypothetical protein
VSWLATCEETAQKLNREMWRSDDPNSAPEAVRNGEGTFGRPAKVYEHSHLWSRSVWNEVRTFTDGASQMWDRCQQLHAAKQKAVDNKLSASEVVRLKVEINVFGPLYDAIDRVRAAVRSELIAPHPSTDFDLDD